MARSLTDREWNATMAAWKSKQPGAVTELLAQLKKPQMAPGLKTSVGDLEREKQIQDNAGKLLGTLYDEFMINRRVAKLDRLEDMRRLYITGVQSVMQPRDVTKKLQELSLDNSTTWQGFGEELNKAIAEKENEAELEAEPEMVSPMTAAEQEEAEKLAKTPSQIARIGKSIRKTLGLGGAKKRKTQKRAAKKGGKKRKTQKRAAKKRKTKKHPKKGGKKRKTLKGGLSEEQIKQSFGPVLKKVMEDIMKINDNTSIEDLKNIEERYADLVTVLNKDKININAVLKALYPSNPDLKEYVYNNPTFISKLKEKIAEKEEKNQAEYRSTFMTASTGTLRTLDNEIKQITPDTPLDKLKNLLETYSNLEAAMTPTMMNQLVPGSDKFGDILEQEIDERERNIINAEFDNVNKSDAPKPSMMARASDKFGRTKQIAKQKVMNVFGLGQKGGKTQKRGKKGAKKHQTKKRKTLKGGNDDDDDVQSGFSMSVADAVALKKQARYGGLDLPTSPQPPPSLPLNTDDGGDQ